MNMKTCPLYLTLYRFNHRCTVRSLWDLWWFGDVSRNMAPFKTHTSYDYETKRHLSYLSRARSVMKLIESLLKADDSNLNLSALSITQSRAKFATGFDKLCRHLSPDLSEQQIDMRHYGDAMYVSFYERMLRHEKKRKLALLTVDV